MHTNWLRITTWTVATTLSLLANVATFAADPASPPGRYYPYSQTTPPGVLARQMQMTRANRYYTQPIKIQLPDSGSVGIFVPGSSHYGGAELKSLNMTNDSGYQIAVAVGATYRMRIADMPDNPSAELFPSIEVLDRMHPPSGLKHDFPIPISITEEEVNHALAGNLVTKVIYLEQPQLADPRAIEGPDSLRTVNLSNRINLLAEADERGRPLLILRLGSRKPVANSRNYGFFGNGGPVESSFPSSRLAAGKTRLRFVSGEQTKH